jgi:hypothetical protein
MERVNEVEEGEAAVGVLLGDADDEAQVGLDHLGLGLVGLAQPVHELVVVVVEAGERHAHLRLDVVELAFEFLDVGVVLLALAARFVQAVELVLGLDELVVMVLANGDEFLGHLLLVIEADEKLLQRGVGLGEFLFRLRLVAAAAGLRNLAVGLLGLGVGAFDAADERLERGQVLVAAVDLLVLDDAVEALAALLELAGQVEVLARGEAEPVEVLLHHRLGVLDALGNFDFLLAGEQRDLAHLLEVHPDGVVQDVELGVGLLLVGKFLLFLPGGGLLVTVDLGGVDDVDLEVAQEHDDGLKFLRVVDALGNRLVEVVPREVTLVLGELDEVAQAFLALGLAGPDGAGGLFLANLGRLGRLGHGGRESLPAAVLRTLGGLVRVTVLLRFLQRRSGGLAGAGRSLAVAFSGRFRRDGTGRFGHGRQKGAELNSLLL